MVANLFPLAPGGVGAVDAGMIGAFVLFGHPRARRCSPPSSIYRVIAFWLPIPPGIVAFFQLRKTVQRWEERGARRQPEPAPEVDTRRIDEAERIHPAAGAAATIESEVRPE